MYDFIRTESGWQVIWGMVPAARSQTSQNEQGPSSDRRSADWKSILSQSNCGKYDGDAHYSGKSVCPC